MHNIEFPEKLECLFKPSRYKTLYGGRGGAKSWGIARALLIIGASKPLRVLCAREFQRSMSDSVHKLLADQIKAMGLQDFYQVQEGIIKGSNGTEFTFHGLRHNIGNIKSIEGTDVAWVEEAQTVGKSSWETLVPTIRKPGSEIWISFNPSLEADETYQRFVLKPPTDSIVVKVNWSDNPWFPDVLRQEKDDLKERDESAYLTVWEGHCKQTLDGAVYANEVKAALLGDRFMRVPYDASKPVLTFWDLGRADKTAIWFAQQVGFEYRMIDYYENQGHALAHYLKQLQTKPYVYGEVWLPHDAENELLASERTIAQQVRAAGYKVQITPKTSIADGIAAARAFFGSCYFDAEACADGLQCLRNYRYEVDPETQQYSKNPLHDWASHGADAFRYAAVSMRVPPPKRKAVANNGGGWMG
ncbi:PBSX family phage terminase large subunit [Massilia atriviolacea]|uniref:PBSX family phage terminase large subunit n=1 Tax=Massilia atriviolacea TaxID=2495579 RepID=A0A430HR85_9BURK|nr:PBSX family phage terminase large subunit [Massilia atriviolacea]RSZ60032.1 PBSX family phage terminase large subunit [Massilia atriviolacea]